MSANNLTPSPISGSRLDENGFVSGLDLGFDGAEDMLRARPRGMRASPNDAFADTLGVKAPLTIKRAIRAIDLADLLEYVWSGNIAGQLMLERYPHPLASYTYRKDFNYGRYLEAQSHFDNMAEDIDQSIAKLAFSNAEIAAIQSGDIDRLSTEIVGGLDELKSEINSGFSQIGAGIDEINQGLRVLTESIDDVRHSIETGFSLTLKQLGAIEKVLKDILGTLQSPERTWAFEMYSIAKELYARGKDKEALAYIDDAINGNGNNRGYRFDSKTHLLMGKILLGRTEKPDQSIIDLPKAKEAFDVAAEFSFPTKEQSAESGTSSKQLLLPYYDAVCSSAWTSYCMGDFTTAQSSYEEVIRHCPSRSRAYYFLGKVLAHVGKRKPALQNFERAIRINHVRAASALLDGDYLNYSKDLAKCIDTVRVERIEEAKDYAKFILIAHSDSDVWRELGNGDIQLLAGDCNSVVNGDLSLSEISASKSAIVIAAQGVKKAASVIKERVSQEVSRLSVEARKRDTTARGNWGELSGLGGAAGFVAFAHFGLGVLLIALGWIILPIVNNYPWPALEYSFPAAWRFIKSIYVWVVAAAVILPFLIPLFKDTAEQSKNEKEEDVRIQGLRARIEPKAKLVKKLDAVLKGAPS